ncbi:hypothetical protein [Halorussus sp. MSC15.2]|uniref:hypothetical protein n=1 Tax=Halorussus sp. MSC15.2 TaxID=2283638 RepID=UPI0013D30C35|nr:hypothetical protein [Halorussus sp. MSC15.2]NEU56579.1 hypothetical protein [Halorussus sp. MSC15.2]
MPGDSGAPGEDIQASGSISRVVAIPFAFVGAIAVIVLVLRGAETVSEYVPELPLVVDVLALTAVGCLLFYGAFRLGDAIQR